MAALDSRICIVGAGAAGLSVAHYLTQARFANVTVLESLGRLGGKCSSITFNGDSFDLGANYVTQDYTETLKLAESVGADLYTEGPTTTLQITSHGQPIYTAPLNAIRGSTSLIRFGWKVARYLWKRRNLRREIDSQGFGGISRHPELCVSFGDWLSANYLTELRTLFEVPITIMGYGGLDEIPAPYALKYMSTKSFRNLVSVGLNLPLRRWPKRFVDGFQRFWERLAVGQAVLPNSRIQGIRRENNNIFVRIEGAVNELEFDFLILACPLIINNLSSFLQLSNQEQNIFQKIVINPYALTTYTSTGLALPERIVGMLPIPNMGLPWAITQQFENNSLVQFYSRIDPAHSISKQDVLDNIAQVVGHMGGNISSPYHTYDEWQYFPHFSVQDIRSGIYDDLEQLQGQNHTYYCGGLLAFELVEPIVRYSKDLVERHFVP